MKDNSGLRAGVICHLLFVHRVVKHSGKDEQKSGRNAWKVAKAKNTIKQGEEKNNNNKETDQDFYSQ